MKPIADGTEHRPATNGDSPRTSCRYWATKRKYPIATKIVRKLTTSDELNALIRNRLRSIIGSADVRWRRTHRAPTTSPTTIAATGNAPTPSWAICLSPKTRASTATSDMNALTRSSRPAFGSRYSGKTIGPRTSNRPMTGNAIRKTEPHQKYSRRTPPTIGPMALPAEKAEIQIGDRSCPLTRVLEHVEDERQGRGGDRRAGDPEQRTADDQHLRAERDGGQDRDQAERGGTDQEQLATSDAIAERAHRHQEPGDREPVDVDDPQELRAARVEVLADRRHGQVQDREVHHVDERGEREDRQPDPFARACLGGLGFRHRSPPIVSAGAHPLR